MNAIKSIFPQRLVKSLLTAGMFCMGISACADDTAAPEKSFSIADIAELERFYDSYANKRIELPGSGYESGDIVQFIDTGISHNTYTMQYEQTGDGLLVTLPDNLASSEYGIYIVRGGMKFLYGKSYFGRFDSRRLTAGNHPRLLMDSSDFETLKAQLAVADPTSLLARMHTECMVVADAWGMSDSELAFELDASGKRILTVAREALQRIFTCAYAYRITGDTKYLEHAERDINTVCDFESWNAKRHFLDVAELSVAVGLGYDWLYHELKPETRANAERALQEYAFQPAEDKVWNLNFYESGSNWNQVCNCGMVCGALAIYETCPARAAALIEKSIDSNLNILLEMYAPDGNYPEGYSYWGYGTTFECLMMALLDSTVGTDNGLSASPGFSRTGNYMLHMIGRNGSFNYSDNGSAAYTELPMWYFADKLGDVSLLHYELRMLDIQPHRSSCAEKRLLPMVMPFVSRLNPGTVPPPSDKVWAGNGKTPVVLVRTGWAWDETDRFLGLKGGKASTSHGHMDAGSFVYDAENVRWATDLGSENYTTLEVNIGNSPTWDMTQNSLRWDVFKLNNRQHNTLTINDSKHLVDGFAPIVSVIDTETEQGGTLDLSPVFADEAASVVRTGKIVNNDYLLIIDEVTARADKEARIRWTLVTETAPTVEETRIVLTATNGKTMFLAAEAGETPVTYRSFPDEPSTDYETPLPTVSIVGYEATVPAGQSVTFRTKLAREL